MAEMKSRERVMRALNHKETDRIPIDVGGISNLTTLHKDAYTNLQKYLGVSGKTTISSSLSQSVQPDKFMRDRFKTDCYPLYITAPDEKELHPKMGPDGSVSYMDEWGITWRCPQGGLYFDPVGHPLTDYSLDELKNYQWPDPKDTSRMTGMRDKAKDLYENTDYAIVLGGPLYGNIFVPCQWLLGYEEFFVRLMTEPEFIQVLLDRIAEYHIGQWDALLDQVGNYVQAVVLSDDLGTQNAPLMRPSIYRELIKPTQKKIASFIKSKADVKIIYHCDGAIYEFLPDMIDIGVDAWNPVQVSAEGMDDTARLKREFGDELCFWGAGCESQTVLSRKNPKEIREEVQRRINDLAPGGGLILSSIHNIQRDVPPENIVAFYDALYELGTAFYK